MPHVVSRRAPLVALVVTAAACADPSAPVAPGADAPAPLARVAGPADAATQPIPDQYIVVFRDDVADVPGLARRLAGANGATVRHTYRTAVKGFAGRMPAGAAAALARHPSVAYVEQDQVVTASTTQSNATWGLDRIDARSGLDKTYSYTATGTGVTAYIIDTGIRYTHDDFDGASTDRARFGYDAFGGSGADCNGHGTHVAGTVGGTTWGVAKNVSLVAVRVLDCGGSGTWSGVIAGIDWVAANHVKPAVANMSLGGGASTAVDDATQRLIAAGVATAVAAGNGNMAGIAQDACNYSPARVPEAMTIGATTSSDAKSSYSNYGSCVDWFAPGSSITSAWYESDTQTRTISGTSMATPHVAGVAALHLEGNRGATPQQTRDALYSYTTKSVVTSAKTANNHLLFSGMIADGGTQPPDDGGGCVRPNGRPCK